MLLVDDSESVRRLVQVTLEDAGMRTREAHGPHVLEVALEPAIDLVLLDVDLGPRVSGFEILERIVAARPSLPVVMLTGSGSTAAECLARGAHDFIKKPFDAPELIGRCRAAIRMKRLHDELEHQAMTDALTGLPNRRHGYRELERMIAAAGRHRRRLSVAVLDLDHFKRINDRFGHSAGDHVLRETARRLLAAVRCSDLVARWGGEEFLVLLPDGPAPIVSHAAERFRGAIRGAPYTCGGEPLAATASVGWTTWTGDSADALLDRADRALYDAKAAGRDCVRAA